MRRPLLYPKWKMMVFCVYVQIILAATVGCLEVPVCGSVVTHSGATAYADSIYIASNNAHGEDESTSVYRLSRRGEYEAAFRQLSETHATAKDCLLFMLIFFKPLLPPLSVMAMLFFFSANRRLSTIFCNASEEEKIWRILKPIMIVIVLFYALPHFAFNPLSKNYVEKVSLSVYLYNKQFGTFQQYALPNFITLLIIPIYYMKRNRISVRALFAVNRNNVKTIVRYLLVGALGWILLSGLIYFIYSLAGTGVSAKSPAWSVQKPDLERFRALALSSKVYVAVIGPLFEEISFRGMVFLLLRKHFKSYISIVASALFFLLSAPSHMGTLTAMVAAFGTGILYGFLVHRTNSLWPSLLLHVAWNSRLFL